MKCMPIPDGHRGMAGDDPRGAGGRVVLQHLHLLVLARASVEAVDRRAVPEAAGRGARTYRRHGLDGGQLPQAGRDGRQGPPGQGRRRSKLHRPDTANDPELRRVDQSDRVGDDDRRQRCIWHQAEQRRQQQHRRQGRARGDQGGLLRPPPTARTTAVCEVPAPAGIAPNRAPSRLPAPVATNSRFASIGGSPGRPKARPAAIVSLKLISAMPSAPGSNCSTRAMSGSVREGNPCGISPTVETRSAFRPKNHESAMPPPTATNGAVNEATAGPCRPAPRMSPRTMQGSGAKSREHGAGRSGHRRRILAW